MDEERRLDNIEHDLRHGGEYVDDPDRDYRSDYHNGEDVDDVKRDYDADYREETAAELAAPMTIDRDYDRDLDDEEATGGQVTAYAGLALSIISLFVLPVILGAAGIVLGFIARRKGSDAIGAWAIGLGAVSIIIGIFVLPFF
ncbi:DUF4190 domain-containing protein [Falsibacillus albus]|uniref:DUF4190 domain-containing protein n=1 Tax=Falsibacillus albus TaxID=2478915 RepID=A0A3L7K7D4_9BACI|nr:DUF4190 domain-containing protein [Falsibacillus albus]RLQ98209.1 DUF4190 domain-containing protein [Falsibacillus albus]